MSNSDCKEADNAEGEACKQATHIELGEKFTLVCALTEEDWRTTTDTTAKTINISTGSDYIILTKKWKCGKLLFQGTKTCRQTSCRQVQSFSMESRSKAFHQRTLTGEETGIHQHNPTNNAQPEQWLPSSRSDQSEQKQTSGAKKASQPGFGMQKFSLLNF